MTNTTTASKTVDAQRADWEAKKRIHPELRALEMAGRDVFSKLREFRSQGCYVQFATECFDDWDVEVLEGDRRLLIPATTDPELAYTQVLLWL